MRRVESRRAHKPKAYIIAPSDFAKLRRLALRAQKFGQQEVGGIVAANDTAQLELWFLTNQSTRAGSFRITRTDYLAARRTVRLRGKYALGTFHSHPISEAIPGKTDIDLAALNSLCLIYDVCGREARLWQILKRGNRKVASEITLEKKATRKTRVVHPPHKTAPKS
jgi:proteasome lid subunit RPN8/RPN11